MGISHGQAVRYLWYISPYAIGGKLLRPFVAPVYALAGPIVYGGTGTYTNVHGYN